MFGTKTSGTKSQVTTHQIGEYLTRLNWNEFKEIPEESEKEGLVVTGWMGQGVLIDPMVEKHLIQFRALKVASAPPDSTPAARLNNLLFALAGLNHKMLMGTWYYDRKDGEVGLSVCVPIHDGLSFEAFEHCLTTVLMPQFMVFGPQLRNLIAGETSVEAILD